MKNRTKRQKAIIRRRIFIILLAVVIAAVVALVSLLLGTIIKKSNKNGDKTQNNYPSDGSSSLQESVPSGDVQNQPSQSKNSITVLSTGDVLIHDNVLWGAEQPDGSYDFSQFYKEAKSYITEADYAVANLEVTFGGTEAGPYNGYPNFNCPDSLADYLKQDGFDMLLTANNHCLDNGLAGMKRTVGQLKAKGLDFLGTKETAADPTYIVKNINGINVGMVSYTYGTNHSASGAGELINYFNKEKLTDFYSEAQAVVDGMKENGAEAIIFYIHWGEEYNTKPQQYQKDMAQKLCNMGVDVIVGGHPHVLQPIELIHSEDSQNTTVCLYSTGNSVSNQRISEMTGLCTTGHTEDGVLFSCTFTRDDDGEVSLTAVDIIPTWVDRYGEAGNYQYTVYPLENAEMAENYGFDTETLAKAKASYERTKEIMTEGLTECQQHLGCEIRFAD